MESKNKPSNNNNYNNNNNNNNNHNKVTTIKIFQTTKNRLDKLKEFERESYDQLFRKILHILNLCRKDPEKAKKFLKKIDKTKREYLTEDLS